MSLQSNMLVEYELTKYELTKYEFTEYVLTESFIMDRIGENFGYWRQDVLSESTSKPSSTVYECDGILDIKNG